MGNSEWKASGRRAFAARHSPFAVSCRLRVFAAKAGEAGVEVGLEVVEVLEPDVQSQRWTGRLPLGRGPIARTIERNDQALEAAPGKAHPEQLEPVEHGRERRLRAGLQHDREQAGGAGEIALPDVVARIGLERRMKHALAFGALREPARDLESLLLVLFQAQQHGAKAAEAEEHV